MGKLNNHDHWVFHLLKIQCIIIRERDLVQILIILIKLFKTIKQIKIRLWLRNKNNTSGIKLLKLLKKKHKLCKNNQTKFIRNLKIQVKEKIRILNKLSQLTKQDHQKSKNFYKKYVLIVL